MKAKFKPGDIIWSTVKKSTKYRVSYDRGDDTIYNLEVVDDPYYNYPGMRKHIDDTYDLYIAFNYNTIWADLNV